MQKVFSHDGKFPIEPGFDHFGYYRNKIRKDLFSETAGLLGSHGEDWYEVREKVNLMAHFSLLLLWIFFRSNKI